MAKREKQYISVFGDLVKKARKRKYSTNKQYTQNGLARMLGVSPAFMNKVEAGAVLPGTELIQRLSEVLDIDSDILFISAGKIPPDIVHLFGAHPQELCALVRRTSEHLTQLYADYEKKLFTGAFWEDSNG